MMKYLLLLILLVGSPKLLAADVKVSSSKHQITVTDFIKQLKRHVWRVVGESQHGRILEDSMYTYCVESRAIIISTVVNSVDEHAKRIFFEFLKSKTSSFLKNQKYAGLRKSSVFAIEVVETKKIEKAGPGIKVFARTMVKNADGVAIEEPTLLTISESALKNLELGLTLYSRTDNAEWAKQKAGKSIDEILQMCRVLYFKLMYTNGLNPSFPEFSLLTFLEANVLLERIPTQLVEECDQIFNQHKEIFERFFMRLHRHGFVTAEEVIKKSCDFNKLVESLFDAMDSDGASPFKLGIVIDCHKNYCVETRVLLTQLKKVRDRLDLFNEQITITGNMLRNVSVSDQVAFFGCVLVETMENFQAIKQGLASKNLRMKRFDEQLVDSLMQDIDTLVAMNDRLESYRMLWKFEELERELREAQMMQVLDEKSRDEKSFESDGECDNGLDFVDDGDSTTKQCRENALLTLAKKEARANKKALRERKQDDEYDRQEEGGSDGDATANEEIIFVYDKANGTRYKIPVLQLIDKKKDDSSDSEVLFTLAKDFMVNDDDIESFLATAERKKILSRTSKGQKGIKIYDNFFAVKNCDASNDRLIYVKLSVADSSACVYVPIVVVPHATYEQWINEPAEFLDLLENARRNLLCTRR